MEFGTVVVTLGIPLIIVAGVLGIFWLIRRGKQK